MQYTYGSLLLVFPAYAGVIPNACQPYNHHPSFPRIRGGDPDSMKELGEIREFSPHTRG